MATALFDKIIFGPIKSRRLGVSLGVNLLPVNGKICNFNCIYCECGWNGGSGEKQLRFTDKQELYVALEATLVEMHQTAHHLDVITFAGNGEPTMHPHFNEVIAKTKELRDKFYPEAKIAVLSNATMVGRESVREGLEMVDRAILKIDSGFEETIKTVNLPSFNYSLRTVIDNIKLLKGEVIIQTMFLRGEFDGKKFDNTTPQEVAAWLEIIKEINPSQVMIYSIDRDTPASGLIKVELEELKKIAIFVEEAGINCSVA